MRVRGARTVCGSTNVTSLAASTSSWSPPPGSSSRGGGRPRAAPYRLARAPWRSRLRPTRTERSCGWSTEICPPRRARRTRRAGMSTYRGSLWRPRATMPAPIPTHRHRPGGSVGRVGKGADMGDPVVHFEVIGEDAAKLQDFYAKVFLWTIHAENPMNYGLVHTEAGRGIDGGVGAGDQGRGVTFYIEVADP